MNTLLRRQPTEPKAVLENLDYTDVLNSLVLVRAQGNWTQIYCPPYWHLTMASLTC